MRTHAGSLWEGLTLLGLIQFCPKKDVVTMRSVLEFGLKIAVSLCPD